MRLILILALLLPVSASASDWQYIGDSSMQGDIETIQRSSDGHGRMWMRIGKTGLQLILYEFSCSGKYRIVEGEEQDRGIMVDIPESKKNWKYIKPDTPFVGAERIVCKQ